MMNLLEEGGYDMNHIMAQMEKGKCTNLQQFFFKLLVCLNNGSILCKIG